MGSHNGLESERSPRYNIRKTELPEDVHTTIGSYRKQFNINITRIHPKKKHSNMSMLEYTARMRDVNSNRWSATSPLEIKARYVSKEKSSHVNSRRRPVLIEDIHMHEKKNGNSRKTSSDPQLSADKGDNLKNTTEMDERNIGISFVSVADLCDMANSYSPRQSVKLKPLHTNHKPTDSHLIRLDVKPSVKLSKSKQKQNLDKNPISPELSALTDYGIRQVETPLIPNEMTFQYLAEALRLNLNKMSPATKKKRAKKRQMQIKNPSLEAIPEDDTISVKSTEVLSSRRLASPPPPELSPKVVISKQSGLTSISEDDDVCSTDVRCNTTQNEKLVDAHLLSINTDKGRRTRSSRNDKGDNYASSIGSEKQTLEEKRNKNKTKAHKRIRKLVFLRDR